MPGPHKRQIRIIGTLRKSADGIEIIGDDPAVGKVDIAIGSGFNEWFDDSGDLEVTDMREAWGFHDEELRWDVPQRIKDLPVDGIQIGGLRSGSPSHHVLNLVGKDPGLGDVEIVILDTLLEILEESEPGDKVEILLGDQLTHSSRKGIHITSENPKLGLVRITIGDDVLDEMAESRDPSMWTIRTISDPKRKQVTGETVRELTRDKSLRGVARVAKKYAK